MGYFMDKLLTLTNLSGGRRALTDEVAFPPRPPPDCPKSPRETEILRTPIQGQKRILDSH